MLFGSTKATLQAKILHTREELRKAQDNLAKTTQAKNSAQEKYEEVLQKYENILEEHVNQTETVLTLQQELQSKDDRIENLEIELQKKTARYNSCLNGNKILLNEIQSAEARIEDLEKGIRQKTTENTKLQTRLTRIQRESNRLHNTIQEINESLKRFDLYTDNEIIEIQEKAAKISLTIEVECDDHGTIINFDPLSPDNIANHINENNVQLGREVKPENIIPETIKKIKETGLYTIGICFDDFMGYETAGIKAWVVPTPI